jgi:hypothetical protein
MPTTAGSAQMDVTHARGSDRATKIVATGDPADLVRGFRELPDVVRHAKFGKIVERVLENKLFDAIVSQIPNRPDEGDWSDRLKRRREALQPYIGKMLSCVYVRLPGIHYTIEVDVATGEIVYWEWQIA